MENIISESDSRDKLGLLFPPRPYRAKFSGMLASEWKKPYSSVKKFANKLGLICNIAEYRLPFSLASCFWIRTTTLDELLNSPLELSQDNILGEARYNDTSTVLSLLLPYIAHTEGYYKCFSKVIFRSAIAS